jgi:putative ABC transport system permease protein
MIKLKLKVVNKLLISIFRMILQLSIVGIYLHYIFELNNLFLNIGYFTFMIAIAAFSVTKTTQISLKMFFIPIFTSILLTNFTLLIFFNKFITNITNIFEAKYMITIGGMLLGNSLKSNIITLSRFLSLIKSNENTYIYSIMLGASRGEALSAYIKESIVSSLNPTLASTATIGLVSLPGMMTGQILGGSIPIVAIKYQIAIMLTIFCSQFLSALIMVIFSERIIFDKYDRVKDCI